MTPEQATRLALDIGREVTELIQKHLAEAASWGPPPTSVPVQWPGEARDYEPCTRCGNPLGSGTIIGDGDGSGRRFAHAACYRADKPVREDEQPVGTFLRDESEWPAPGVYEVDGFRVRPMTGEKKLDVNEMANDMLRRQGDGGVAEDAKRVLRGQPPLQPRPADDEDCA
jgi:hypothetical protein